MKRVLLAAALFVPLLSLADGGKNLEVKIKDGEMHCEECAESVTSALKKIPNVDQASVRVIIAKNKATLHVTSEDKKTVEQIKSALKDAGYDVTAVNEVAMTGAKAKKTN